MRALYDSGRQVEALREFQQYRRLLIEEVGVEPSSESVELDRRLATGGTVSTPRAVGNYLLHERLGVGAFAVVHRATQRTLGRDVATTTGANPAPSAPTSKSALQPTRLQDPPTVGDLVGTGTHP